MHQVYGRKRWLVCSTARRTEAKLDYCARYDAAEVGRFEETCEVLDLEPGDQLLLPRRTLHSARALGDAPSVHVTRGPARKPSARSGRATRERSSAASARVEKR